MLTFDISDIEEGSYFLLDLMKKTTDLEKRFMEQWSKDIMELLLQLHTKIFEEGINYQVEVSQYAFIFDPLIELVTSTEQLKTIETNQIDYLIELVIINLVSSDCEKNLNKEKDR